MQLWKLPEISIAPEQIGTLFGFPITNTLLGTWIAIIVLLIVFGFGLRKRNLIPSGLQNALEWMIEFLLGLVEGVSGKEKGKRFFPLVATFFIFIMVANLLDVIPGVDTLGTVHGAAHPVQLGPIALLFGEDSNKLIPWLRPATTDLNLNISMAIVSVVATQFFGFHVLGSKEQLSKYFNFRALFTKGPMGLVDVFVGLLEVVSELGRIISFSFRLFGNVFAGSVLLAVFAFLLPVVATVVFIPFEMFVAIIQAFVFSFLTLLFMEVGTTSHEGHHEAGEEVGEHGVAAAH
ncbi:MAG: F0F1 ATP synthase subunit A [Ktedonobacteraceae bacterium]|nr:F0F1 ATP synthase subunit A [Ktedonobacteraceae bacterium]